MRICRDAAIHGGEDEGIRSRLVARDRRLWLEMDSSHLNSLVAPALRDAFPQARFILTIRECYSWLDSVFDTIVNSGGLVDSPDWSVRKDLFGATGPQTYSSEERALERHGIPPVGELLRYWAQHNQRMLDALAGPRLFVVRTDRLSEKIAEIASFLDVPSDSLNRDRIHLNITRVRHGIAHGLGASFLEDQVGRFCGEIMGTFFPDIRSLDAGLADRERRPGKEASQGAELGAD